MRGLGVSRGLALSHPFTRKISPCPLPRGLLDLKLTVRAPRSALGKAIGFWDPLGALDTNFWGLGNEGTIGYLRHAEIKHGRVAMAAFLGYCAQSTPLVSGPHKLLPFKGYEPGLTPPEQWDAIPVSAKLQIFTLIGMLESYGETCRLFSYFLKSRIICAHLPRFLP